MLIGWVDSIKQTLLRGHLQGQARSTSGLWLVDAPLSANIGVLRWATIRYVTKRHTLNVALAVYYNSTSIFKQHIHAR